MPALRAGDFRAGEPVELALKFTRAKSVRGAYGRQAMFTTSRGALYLDPEPASDIETQVRSLAIAPGETIRVMRMKKPDGADGWEVQRVEDTLEEQLEKSPDAEGPDCQAASAEWPETASAVCENKAAAASVTAAQDNSQQHSGSPPAAPVIPAGTLKLMACFMQAIDALTEAQVYCTRKGLRITFTSEDVRATAISCYINCVREGR